MERETAGDAAPPIPRAMWLRLGVTVLGGLAAGDYPAGKRANKRHLQERLGLIRDEQAPGRYRLHDRGDDVCFAFAGPATSFKPVLFPSRRLIWQGTRRPDGFDVDTPAADPQRRVLLGIRGCDLAAVGIHDRVLRDRWGGRPYIQGHQEDRYRGL